MREQRKEWRREQWCKSGAILAKVASADLPQRLPGAGVGHQGGHGRPEIPKLRQGAYFPSLLEPRRRHERVLLAVVQEAYVHGVSTRAVDHLTEALA